MTTERQWLKHKLDTARKDGATEQDIAGFVRDYKGTVTGAYFGSVVPLGVRCSCGGAVVTEWLYYYGPTLHPRQGEWGGECLECGSTYTRGTMNGFMKKNPRGAYCPKPGPAKKKYVTRYTVIDGALQEKEVQI